MDAWTLDRYRRPYLAAEVSAPDERDVALRRGEAIRVITFDDNEAARDTAQMLFRLREPDEHFWERIRRGEVDPGWSDLMRRLDEWAMVEDASPADVIPALESEGDKALASIASAVAYVRAAIAPESVPALIDQISFLLEAHPIDVAGSDEAWSDPNFYRAAARISLIRLRKSSPPAHAAALAMIDALRVGQTTVELEALADPQLAGCYSVHQMKVHLTALADMVVRSLSDGAKRLCQVVPGRTVTISGTAFAHDAEAAMRSYATMVGEGNFARGLVDLRAIDQPLAVGCHIEEYHVTRRFVEMITPLMRIDFADPLRSLVFRYFAEEVGHEAFERATCAAFGMGPDSLAAACPLPLHVMFVDLFTELADSNPLGFFTAVPITEGLLGEASPVNRRFDELARPGTSFREVYRRHEELNVALNHASISRLALESFTAVTPVAQGRALASLALVFELNFRAWEMLVDFYRPQTVLSLPEPFDSRLALLAVVGVAPRT